jgi:hypothetical protein
MGFVLDGRRRRARSTSPSVTLATARHGAFVRVVGTIREGETVLAPASGRPCVCFSAAIRGMVLVEPTRLGGHHARTWHDVASRVGGAPFVIDDGTGTAVVDPGGAFIRAVVDHTVTSHNRLELKLHDPSMPPANAICHEYIVDEGVITVGTRVVVEAMVRRPAEGLEAPVFRGAAGTRIELVGAPDRSASISNLPANITDAVHS